MSTKIQPLAIDEFASAWRNGYQGVRLKQSGAWHIPQPPIYYPRSYSLSSPGGMKCRTRIMKRARGTCDMDTSMGWLHLPDKQTWHREAEAFCRALEGAKGRTREMLLRRLKP